MKRFNIRLFGLTLAACMLGAAVAYSAALTEARNTPYRTGDTVQLLQGSNVVYAGAMVAISASTGTAQPAADTASTLVIGKSLATSDNTGANYDATTTLNVQRGIFGWANVSNITDAAIGGYAYVVDDQTVGLATNATNDIKAGTIIDVDSDYVWVDSTAQ